MNIPKVSKKTFSTAKKLAGKNYTQHKINSLLPDYYEKKVCKDTVYHLFGLNENKQAKGSYKIFLQKVFMLKVQDFYKKENELITSILQNNADKIKNLEKLYSQRTGNSAEFQKEIIEKFTKILLKGYKLEGVKPKILIADTNGELSAGWQILNGELIVDKKNTNFAEMIASVAHEFTHLRQDLNTLQTKGAGCIDEMLFKTHEIVEALSDEADPQNIIAICKQVFIEECPFMKSFLNFAKHNRVNKHSIRGLIGKVNLKEDLNYITYTNDTKKYFSQYKENHAFFVEDTAFEVLKGILKEPVKN